MKVFGNARLYLCEPLATSEDGDNRDAVVRSVTELYVVNRTDFPSEAREPGSSTFSPSLTRFSLNYSSVSTKTGELSIASSALVVSCACLL
jgi:hypothetical protein